MLEQIGLADIKPKYTVCLGKVQENKGCTIKAEMKDEKMKDENQEKAMRNFKFLKGAEDCFGKISDY